VARAGYRHAGRPGTAMIGAYRARAAGRPAGTARWHLASDLPLAAALVRFGTLTGRGPARPVQLLLTRDGLMVACELAWPARFMAGL
jgi:decaprenyl-phosphate phosphoribosyltransferase